MNYREYEKSYTSNNGPSWFKGAGIEGYQVPPTVMNANSKHAHEDQKENYIDEHEELPGYLSKGIKFDKAQKVDYFNDKRNNPPPTAYFKTPSTPSQSQIKAKVNESSFFKNYPRFQTLPKDKSSNNYGNDYEVTKVASRHQTLATAETAGYIDFAQLKATWTPGPGSYDVKLIRHRSLSLFAKSKKNGFPQEKNPKQKAVKSIGPQSYMIPRSLSLACSVKLKQPLKQGDSKIKQGITRVNLQRDKACNKAGPGKYLKIQEWCKYKEKKKLMNGLTVCSKPVNHLRLYN